MRMLRAWLFRERAVRGVGAIELDVVERQIDREQAAVGNAAGEATDIEQRLQRVRREFSAAMTDRRSPGIIDASESRKIARALIGTAVTALHHTTHLEALK